MCIVIGKMLITAKSGRLWHHQTDWQCPWWMCARCGHSAPWTVLSNPLVALYKQVCLLHVSSSGNSYPVRSALTSDLLESWFHFFTTDSWLNFYYSSIQVHPDVSHRIYRYRDFYNRSLRFSTLGRKELLECDLFTPCVMGNSVVTDVQFGHLFLVCIKYVALLEVTCGLFRKISHCS